MELPPPPIAPPIVDSHLNPALRPQNHHESLPPRAHLQVSSVSFPDKVHTNSPSRTPAPAGRGFLPRPSPLPARLPNPLAHFSASPSARSLPLQPRQSPPKAPR